MTETVYFFTYIYYNIVYILFCFIFLSFSSYYTQFNVVCVLHIFEHFSDIGANESFSTMCLYVCWMFTIVRTFRRWNGYKRLLYWSKHVRKFVYKNNYILVILKMFKLNFVFFFRFCHCTNEWLRIFCIYTSMVLVIGYEKCERFMWMSLLLFLWPTIMV